MSDTETTTAPAEVEPQLDPAPTPEAMVTPAAADLAAQLRSGGELTPEDRAQIADLVLFVAFARDQLYPVVAALAPVAQRASQLGGELQAMGPLQLVSVLTGR